MNSNDEVMQPADFDKSFYVLLSIGYWIMTEHALESEAGRAQIRAAFADGMLRGGTWEDLRGTPEFRAVLEDAAKIQARADAGEFNIDISSGLEAEVQC